MFTSGATESNNLAILGLAPFGEACGRRHVVSTAIEHKAVLEPLEALTARGFEVTMVAPGRDGAVERDAVRSSVRDDTLLVSVMQVNNETGVRQPIDAIAASLAGHDAYLHVDAAQGFGKELAALRLSRVDLVSISSHKLYGPAGVGALVARRRGFHKAPLECLMRGGGQERGLRPGTLPVALLAGLGATAERAVLDLEHRRAHCQALRQARAGCAAAARDSDPRNAREVLAARAEFLRRWGRLRGAHGGPTGLARLLQRLRVYVAELRPEPCSQGDGPAPDGGSGSGADVLVPLDAARRLDTRGCADRVSAMSPPESSACGGNVEPGVQGRSADVERVREPQGPPDVRVFRNADEQQRVRSVGGIGRLEVVQPRHGRAEVVVEQQRLGRTTARPQQTAIVRTPKYGRSSS